MWAVEYRYEGASRSRCRLFTDMIHAVRFYSLSRNRTKLWTLTPGGWLSIAYPAPDLVKRTVRPESQRMNREVLVQ
jgi:hypothetical protein